MAQLGEYLLGVNKVLALIPQHHINWPWTTHLNETLVLRRQRQEYQKSKVILSYSEFEASLCYQRLYHR